MTDLQTRAADLIEGRIKLSYRNAPSRLRHVEVRQIWGGDIDIRVTLTELGERSPHDLMKWLVKDALDLFDVTRIRSSCGHDRDGLVYARVRISPPAKGWPSKRKKR